ncbi:MAG: HipA domain-containing protein, partial [Sphaerochaetaceae bacterium]|nr:HipA domain-containing protein [Sphaerochaetaceae bacterium]
PIEKTDNINIFNSIENEWYCSNFFRMMNLPVAKSEILTFDDEKVLSVERFDRLFDKLNERILRLPQEDFCQVLNIPYFLKYESDGGPCALDILNIIRQSSNKKDQSVFFKAQILNWLISATDGHAKNYSIFLEKDNSFSLAPFYDIMSFSPYLGNKKGQIHKSKIKLAMSIKSSSNKKKYKIDKINRNNWDITASSYKINNKQYNKLMEEIIETSIPILNQLNSQLPSTFPSIIAESITNDVINHIKILKN